jgi:uncharacterized membrane protein
MVAIVTSAFLRHHVQAGSLVIVSAQACVLTRMVKMVMIQCLIWLLLEVASWNNGWPFCQYHRA